jgi:hypothetical protein
VSDPKYPYVLETAQRLVGQIRPLLAGLPPEVQGAVLADLTAIWLAGHAGFLRGELLDMQVATIRRLIPVNENLMFGEAGHPADRQ